MTKRIIKIVAMVFLLLAAAGWYFLSKSVSEAPVDDELGRLLVGGGEIQVEIADNVVEQAQGLSGRGSMCETCGMLFVFPQAQKHTFWMKDMKFPLDIIFIRDGKVKEIFSDVPIPSAGDIPVIASFESSDQVLELNAGGARKFSIAEGDSVGLVDE